MRKMVSSPGVFQPYRPRVAQGQGKPSPEAQQAPSGAPRRSSLSFTLPMLPPSVNHYVEHPAKGVHIKSPAAKAWEADFFAMLPAEARGEFVTGQRFRFTLEFYMGPHDKGDVDNHNKLPIDCCAKAGMLRNPKGKELSDAWVKELVVRIRDSDEDRRLRGPKTVVLIEALC